MIGPSENPSVVYRINGERLAVLGWGRAILMQLAHPKVAAGVGDHSGFRTTALGAVQRLLHTVDAMLSLTFGSDEQAERTAQAILAIHDRVHGTLKTAAGPFPAGTTYSAHEPHLLLWVHATLLDSMVRTYESLVAPLSSRDRDDYVAAAAGSMARIGLPGELAPLTFDAMQTYLESMITGPDLAVTPQSRELALAVIDPAGGWIVWPFVRAQRLLTIGLLPPQIRTLYGFAWTVERERRFRSLQQAIRRVRTVSPGVLSRWTASRRLRSSGPVLP